MSQVLVTRHTFQCNKYAPNCTKTKWSIVTFSGLYTDQLRYLYDLEESTKLSQPPPGEWREWLCNPRYQIRLICQWVIEREDRDRLSICSAGSTRPAAIMRSLISSISNWLPDVINTSVRTQDSGDHFNSDQAPGTLSTQPSLMILLTDNASCHLQALETSGTNLFLMAVIFCWLLSGHYSRELSPNRNDKCWC